MLSSRTSKRSSGTSRFPAPCPSDFRWEASSLSNLRLKIRNYFKHSYSLIRLWCKVWLPGIFGGRRDRVRMMAKKVTCSDQLFKGRHFEREIIILCVRWYLRFKLSFRDLVEMMAERGLSPAPAPIRRWVRLLVRDLQRRCNHFARQSGQSWRVDETYVKIRGVWTYLYRAVDRDGKTVDFRLSPHRDIAAAKS